MTPILASKAKEIWLKMFAHHHKYAYSPEQSFDNWTKTDEGKRLLLGEDWISVKDRLPEINEPLMGYNDDGVREVFIPNYEATVLAFDPELGVFKARIDKRHHWTEVSSVSSKGGINVTHWQPLPEPPKP